jgi:hypothetical protein
MLSSICSNLPNSESFGGGTTTNNGSDNDTITLSTRPKGHQKSAMINRADLEPLNNDNNDTAADHLRPM